MKQFVNLSVICNLCCLYEGKKIAKIYQEIYPFGKSSNSPRSFGFKETRRIDKSALFTIST